MGAESLGSRAIIGSFYRLLGQNEGAAWVPSVSMQFTSNQESETYKWLGMSPQMREWLGGRLAKGFRDAGVTIINKHYESTLEVLIQELRRDKTGQIMIRIAEMARRANAHWAKLLSLLILAGEGSTMGLAYDGQFFFDTDHSEGDSGVQSNSIQYDIATTTAPTSAEAEKAIMNAVQAMLAFLDDQGEPMNEDALSFLVMVPIAFYGAFAAALKNPVIVDGSGARTNTIVNAAGFNFQLVANPRLTWTTKFAVFRTDSNTKALIRQEESPINVEAVAEGSEEAFRNYRYLYGIDAWRNVGFGMWQDAILTTFI